jgi:hypothetical protein
MTVKEKNLPGGCEFKMEIVISGSWLVGDKCSGKKNRLEIKINSSLSGSRKKILLN